MKNPPTLVDAFVSWSLHQKSRPAMAEHCRAMLPARKIVLAESMVRYLADMEMTLLLPTITKLVGGIILLIDAVRVLARTRQPRPRSPAHGGAVRFLIVEPQGLGEQTELARQRQGACGRE